MTKKYTKKPAVFEALQFKGLDNGELSPKTVDFFSGGVAGAANPGEGNTIVVLTLEGKKTASVGDYIIKEANGDFKVVQVSKFHQNYQPAE